MKRVLGLLLMVVVLLCLFGGISVNAADTSDLTFKLNSDGISYYISDCSTSASGELVIPDTYNSKPVTRIGDSAFYGCKSLASIIIPDSVTSIGDYAFRGCTGLTSITIGESVTSIGDFAFYKCTGLASIIIPDSVTSIGDYAFYDCTGLEKIYWNAKSVSDFSPDSDVFYNAGTSGSGIEVIFGDTVEKIPSYLFYVAESSYRPKVKSVIIGEDVTSIGNYAFYNCKSLTSIIIPDSVTSIGDYAFYDCIGLTSITIGEGVISIGDAAFCYCKGLTSITVPEGVTNIGDYAFQYCTSLTSVTIPDGVTSIGNCAFYGCTGLTSITIGKSVTSIGERAFYNCTGLEKIYWNAKSVSDFDSSSNVFYNVGTSGSGIEVIFGDTVEKIPSYLFCVYDSAYIPKVTKVTIGSNVTSIGERAFYYCTSLEKIYWNAKSVSDFDFSSHVFINAGTSGSGIEVIFGDTVEKIPSHLFHVYDSPYIPKVTKVIIGEDVTSIGNCAFYDCTGLTSITIGESVTSIGKRAFYNCTSLEKIYWNAKSVSDFDSSFNVFYNAGTSGSGIEVVFGDTVEKIPSYLFYVAESSYRPKVKSVIIGEDVTSIGNYAFSGCFNLVEVITPCNSYARTYFNGSNINLTHGLAGEWVIDKSANCGVNGTKSRKCTICGDTLETETIPATGKHTSSDWIIDTPATVSVPGSKHKACTACGEVLETSTIAQLKPATPKVATENALTGVLVKWNAVTGATKYQVYRRQGGSNTWTLVGTTTSTSITDTKVSSGIYYVYSVRAYNNIGLYSDFVSANTQTRKYMAVPKLTSISNATNGLYIKWNAVAGVTNGYRVYRRGAGSTYWTYLGTVKTTYFTDTSVKARSGEYFRYTVIADGGYHSKFDTTGLYLKRLANPTLKSAVSSKTGITVKWETVVGTTGYYVYRKTANSGWVRIATVGGTNNTSYVDKTAKKGVTYTYTVRAVYGATTSYFNSGISCKDKY